MCTLQHLQIHNCLGKPLRQDMHYTFRILFKRLELMVEDLIWLYTSLGFVLSFTMVGIAYTPSYTQPSTPSLPPSLPPGLSHKYLPAKYTCTCISANCVLYKWQLYYAECKVVYTCNVCVYMTTFTKSYGKTLLRQDMLSNSGRLHTCSLATSLGFFTNGWDTGKIHFQEKPMSPVNPVYQ